MKKKYIRPLTESLSPDPSISILALSVGETTNINVHSDESQSAEDALTKEDPFEFDWE